MKKLIMISLLLAGCTAANQHQQLRVSVKNDSLIQISGMEANTLAGLAADSLSVEQWQQLLPVYPMPADTDMKDFAQPCPGRYFIKSAQVAFVADTPFAKGKMYFVRSYQFHDDSGSGWDIFKSKWKSRKPQYQEVIFKP
jgi:hypothetical protein